MKQITLKGLTTDGSSWQQEFDSSATTINLQQLDLISIDLSPLSSCTGLVHLDLSSNELPTVDLSPLNACTELEDLLLYNNRLYEIDLSPLSSCPKLHKLNLYNNHLSTIDLSPLSHCSNLTKLNLYANTLSEVDLSPLNNCPVLQEFIIASPVNLLWSGVLPTKENLPSGLQSYYGRLSLHHPSEMREKTLSLTSSDIDRLMMFRNAVSHSEEIPFSVAARALSFASSDELIDWFWTIDLPGFRVDYSSELIVVTNEQELINTINSLVK